MPENNGVHSRQEDPRRVYFEVQVDGNPVNCLLDTGVEITLMSLSAEETGNIADTSRQRNDYRSVMVGTPPDIAAGESVADQRYRMRPRRIDAVRN